MADNLDFLTNNTEHDPPEFQELESPEGELHLRFYVPSGNEFALPANGIREVLSPSPDRITPIPNASPLLLGTLNIRGRIIWVSDLGQFLGDSTPLNTDRPEIYVVAVEDQDTMMGLAIDRLGPMYWLDPEKLQPATSVPDNMAPFLRGEWVLEEEPQQTLRLLDHLAILRSARWGA
jgi:twitching motility protein PilI